MLISRKKWKRLFPGMENGKAKYNKYKRNYEMNDCTECCNTVNIPNIFKKKKSLCELAPLNVPCPEPVMCYNALDWYASPKQEGINPMRYNDNYASASASVSAQPSDTAVTRDYLLGRLAKADYPKDQELRKFFNLHVDNSPKTYKQLIDIITAGTYTIDAKIAKKLVDLTTDNEDDFHFVRGPFYGIIWPGPVSDWKGYEAAKKEQQVQYTKAKDTIMVSDAAATGLAALQAFEAWLPTVTTPALVAAAA